MTLAELAHGIETGVRLLVAGAFALTAVIALTHWGVRKGSIPAFGGWARWVRSWSDRLLDPMERKLARAGGNPQDAPWWLVGTAVVGGLLLMAAVSWVLDLVLQVWYVAQHGTTALAAVLIHYLFAILMMALLIRVIGSWLGVGRYNKWMRPMYWLTDWLVTPVQRILPPAGMLDFSPLVAYVVLYFGERLLLRIFLS